MPGEVALGSEMAGHRVETVIGRGGMGVVYLAEHLRLGRKVALKVLNPELSENEQFRERFVRESQLAATINHPNVITVFDAGEAAGFLYISMAYAEGGDLGKLLRAQGRLDPSLALGILWQVAAGLDAAHAQGLVHRDVKPANVLLAGRAPKGHVDRVYLSDFGITKKLGAGAAGVITKSGQFVGTIHYMAPQQIRGGQLDGRADVYSLGCLLYQCLTGDVPFPRDDEVSVMYAHLHDPPPSINAARPDLGHELDPVIERAMAKAPERRFDSATDLMDAAMTALPGVEVDTVPGTRPSGSAPVADVTRTHRWRTRLAAAVLGGIAVVAAVLAFVLAGGGGEGTDLPSPNGPSASDAAVTLDVTWTRVADPDGKIFGGPGVQAIARARSFGTDVVAVGVDGSHPDLDPMVWALREDTWTRLTIREPGDQVMAGLEQLNQGLVATGTEGTGNARDGAVWTSDDARSWRRAPTSSELGGPGAQSMERAVLVGGAQLIAVGTDSSSGDRDAAIWRSSGGREWKRETFPGSGRQGLYSVFDFHPYVVAVGYDVSGGDRDAAIWVLDHGLWKRVSERALRAPGSQQINAVTVGGPGMVAAGSTVVDGDRDAAVWTTIEGRQWSPVPSAVFGGPGDQEMLGIAKVGGRVFTVGYDSAGGDKNVAMWVSIDGFHWVRQPTAAPLEGPGDQIANAILPLGTIYLFGSESIGDDQDAAVWVGHVRRRAASSSP